MLLAEEKSGIHVSDECFKMALTDAISVAAKALGIGADVYFEKDRTKYSVEDTQASNTPVKAKAEAKPEAKVNEAKNEVDKPKNEAVKGKTWRVKANEACARLAELRGNGATLLTVAQEAMRELNVSCKSEAEYEDIYKWCMFEIEELKFKKKQESGG